MSWDEERIRSVLHTLARHRGDSTLIEVKRADKGLPKSLPETICAFANMPDGGTIILGVDERSGFTITGVGNPAEIEGGIASQAREAVDPPPFIATTSVDIDGKTLVVAEITGLSITNRPARHKGRAYLRQADGDYVMKDNDLHMIEVAKLHATEQTRYDQQPIPGSSITDLDQDLVAGYLANRRASSPRLAQITEDETLLRLTNVITASGELTISGLYALGTFPQGHFPSLGVTAAVQLPRDGSGARTRNLRTFDGPIPSLLEDSLNWIRQNLSTDRVYTADGHMLDRTEIPMNAIREVVANALVHRDLGPDTVGVGKSVEIRVQDNRLTITSPGGLRGVSKEQLESEQLSRAAVNQRLYEIVKYVDTPSGHHIIEGEGGGIREMFAATRDADLARPTLVDSGVQFVVILWRGSRFTPEELEWLTALPNSNQLTHLQRAVLVSLRNGETWTTGRVLREFSPVSPERAEDELRQLVLAGLVHEGLHGRILPTNSRMPAKDATKTIDIDDRAGELAHLGKNVPLVISAIRRIGEAQLRDIIDATGLSAGQVRYALTPLIDGGHVQMSGGRGVPTTTYTCLG